MPSFMFRAMLPVMVVCDAPDYESARQMYADIDGATYTLNFATEYGPVLAHIAIDDSNPVLEQVDEVEPPRCPVCPAYGERGRIVAGRCTWERCPSRPAPASPTPPFPRCTNSTLSGDPHA
ncbi:hypothetical protein ACIP93_32530 [Streptomyces sp. NPDC088745]|uniref:hypothetical protein n=1 Tax=Streptomyces sp. NPDC088745 TaxID=3365884 RepID=UPI003819C964